MTKRQVIQEVYDVCNSFTPYSVITVWKEGRVWKTDAGYSLNDVYIKRDKIGAPECRIFHRNDYTLKKDIAKELDWF